MRGEEPAAEGRGKSVDDAQAGIGECQSAEAALRATCRAEPIKSSPW